MMIDYLIFDPKKFFGLIWSYILKIITFLILIDFSRIFEFFGFILNLFLFKNRKTQLLFIG